ncbi:hypothetical protein GDO81_002635 [Engystomops pustulosus]|uniref:Survival Motor Neuron Gemin2-binding domain-containing protein n=1 Tax=Engystomops pustulosus TaxID=76066 RepID=A0AAV7DQZ1_ENGPU|nr:hypothetical protein GDO81_002635 [Engystomops pustulosus]
MAGLEESGELLFRRGAGQSDDSDIWDDTALIKAYDKAVSSFKRALKNGGDFPMEPVSPEKNTKAKRKNNKKNKSRKKTNAAPLKKDINGDEHSTDESDKSSRDSDNRDQQRAAAPKPSHWNLPFPPAPPPFMPGFGQAGDKSTQAHPFIPGWPPSFPPGPPLIPPPPPMGPDIAEDDEALGSMLIAWYMSGYHTGYYLGLKQGRMEASYGKYSHPK